jgi:hypothetical protein
MKIRPVEAELLHVDRQTDMTDLIDGFQNFANVPKIAVIWTGLNALNRVKILAS